MALAHDQPINGNFFILEFDKEVENKGRSSLINAQPKHMKLLRGSLLESIAKTSQWQDPARRQRGNGKFIKLRRIQTGNDTGSALEVDCFSSEVHRITKDEMELLLAISSDYERFKTYTEPDLLKNALALQENMRVMVEVKCDTMKQTLPGIVRYIGPLPNERGKQFGIELHKNPGQGCSDGMFGKKRFFNCGTDCGVFVTVNKLKFDIEASLTVPRRDGSQQAPRQSFIESDLKKDMEVYVSTKKGSKEEYVKGKIIYIGKPKGEVVTFVGVELEKPRTSPWDGTFKSHRLCHPKLPWHSELVPINDIVPAEFLEGQESVCNSLSSLNTGPITKGKAAQGRANQVKRGQSVSANNGKIAKKTAKKDNDGQSRATPSLLHSFSGVHATNPYDIATIPCQNTYNPLQTLSGSNEGTNNKGQDIHLKVQEQLLDNAKKACKDASQMSNPKGLRKFSKDFMSRLQSLGSNKEGSTLQAGIGFSAVVSGKVAMVDLESSPLVDVDVTDMPPLGTELIEEICVKVEKQWAYLAHYLEVGQTRIEKVSAKTSTPGDRVILILVHWWKKVNRQPKAIQTLAYALSQLQLEQLAGRVLIAVSEMEMDKELLEIVAERTYSNWRLLASELGLENEVIDDIDRNGQLYKEKARKMLDVWDKEISIGFEKLSLLVRACRHSGNTELANELEQGLDTDTLERISRMVDDKKWRVFGEALGFSAEYLTSLEADCASVKLRVYMMLGSWRNTQPFTSDKILAISTALDHCGLRQLAWEICRGLDEDLLNDLAFKLQKDWRRVGGWLHLPNPELAKLDRNYTNEAKKTYQMLVMWRKRQHASCDLLGELAKGLRETEHREISDWLVQGIHDDVLDKVASLIADKWEELAKTLGFDKPDIDAIRDRNKLEAQRIYKMLCQWRYREHYTKDRVQGLAKGLRECELQDVAELVLELVGCRDSASAPSPSPKDELTTKQLMQIAEGISTRWQLLSTDLKVDRSDVLKLTETKLHPKEQCARMLLIWKDSLPAGNNGKDDLIRALDNCERHDLVVSVLGPRAGQYDVVNNFAGSNPTPPEQHIYEELPERTVSEENLLQVAEKVGIKWKLMAHNLGFKTNEIIEIEKEAPNSANQCYCMLQHWKDKLSPSNSGHTDLVFALEKCGHRDLVAKLWSHSGDSPSGSEHFDTSTKPRGNSEMNTTNIPVDKDVLFNVAGSVEFTALTKALPLTQGDIESITKHYVRMDQRCFQALDAWARRGPGGKRTISELLQVMGAMGRTDMVKYIQGTAHKDTRGATPEVKKDYDPQKYSNPKLADNKDTSPELRPPAVTKEKVKEHVAMQFEDVPLVDNAYELEVNSMVEFTKNDEKLYGVMRWMGYHQRVGSMAGIELEEKLTSGGTDGTLFGNRVFSCENGRAIFVKLAIVRPDSRFPSQADTFTKRKRFTSQDFGGFKSPTLKGYIHPPRTLSPEFVGRKKGIQGDQNSCYLDTTLFSMYAYSNIFDDILHRNKSTKDLHEYETVQTMLREDIVNPLRSYGFVRADRVLKLREYLDQLGTTKGLISEEKDPEEFLHTFLQEVTKTEPFLHIRQQGGKHVEKSYHYQIFMEKNESYQLPSVEQLLHYSFLHSDLQLAKVPPCLIMQMPRFGKDYRMYNRILPSLYLDISDLLEGWPRICSVCGKLAELECRDCSGKLAETGIVEAINSYCQDCSNTIHVHSHRKNHKVKEVQLSDEFLARYAQAKENGMMEQDIHEKVFAPRKLMELFAVVCIETSHYVAFVKAGSGAGSQWVFFDSMADREGDQQGYNIPEITHLREFQSWLENQTALKETNDKDLPPPLRRLLCDGYMCMYQDPDVVKHHQKQFQQTTPIDSIAEPLAPLPNVRERSASNEMQIEESLYVVPTISSGRSSTSSYGLGGSSQHSNFLDSPTPGISYTTHRGPSQGSSTKAAANAALCYRNYADALTSPPPGSTAKGFSDPAADYRKYAEVGSLSNGSKQHVFSTPAYKPTQHQPTTYRNRGSSLDDELASNSNRQHVGQIEHDDDSRRLHGSDTSSIHSRDSQYTSLPDYRMSLSKEAEQYSRPKESSVIVNQHHILHPPSRNDFSNVMDVVADAPIPRTHPSRVQVGTSQSQPRYDMYSSSSSSSRYQTNSDSASRLAKHGIKQPPIEDELDNVVAGISLQGGGTAI